MAMRITPTQMKRLRNKVMKKEEMDPRKSCTDCPAFRNGKPLCSTDICPKRRWIQKHKDMCEYNNADKY